MAFTFGTSSAASTPAFGAPKSTGSIFGGGGFGSTTSTSTTPAFGGFGAKTTASATGFGGFGGFGATKTTAATGFSFGSTSTSAAPSGNLFSGLGTQSTSLFGGAKTTGFSGFGFGSTTTTTTAPAGFGSTGLFSSQQQNQQAAAPPQNPLAIMTSALTMPTLFGDERDGIIAKLNQLQALWGHGKAFYAPNAQPIPFAPENPFSRFKSIGYSCLPSAKDSEGFISLDLKHKESYVKDNQTQLVEELHKVLGSKPTLSVCVDGVRNLPGDKSEVIIYVVERQANGASRRILATELYAFLNQDANKTKLKNLGVENMIAKTALTESQLSQFLDSPPLGIDAILWEQAKKDNPDPKRLIPVPMMGFSELLNRLQHQQYQSTQHKRRLDLVSDEISKLQASHSTTVAKIAQYKRKHLELGHRVLEVMINLETIRKVGYAIEPEEEQLRIQLESIQTELNAPMQFKGRLKELLSQIHLQSQINTGQNNMNYILDDHFKMEIKHHLAQQQNGLLQLISIIKEDMEDLKTIENGIVDSVSNSRR